MYTDRETDTAADDVVLHIGVICCLLYSHLLLSCVPNKPECDSSIIMSACNLCCLSLFAIHDGTVHLYEIFQYLQGEH